MKHWTQFWAIPLLTNFWWFFKIVSNWVQYPLHTQDQNPNYPTFEKPDSSLYICRRQLERAGHILRPIITCTISRNIMIFRRRPSHRKIMWSFGDDFPQWVKKKKQKSGIYDDVICSAIKGKDIQNNVISLSSLFPKNAFFLVFFWHIVNLAPFVEWWSKSTFFFRINASFILSTAHYGKMAKNVQ